MRKHHIWPVNERLFKFISTVGVGLLLLGILALAHAIGNEHKKQQNKVIEKQNETKGERNNANT